MKTKTEGVPADEVPPRGVRGVIDRGCGILFVVGPGQGTKEAQKRAEADNANIEASK